MDASAIWDAPAEAKVYRDEERSHGGYTFKVTRRALSFPEEARILAQVTDQKTKRPDTIEMLALTVEKTVRENNFGLTAERVRKELADHPSFAWFLIGWLCGETMRNVAPSAEEELRKKSGP